MEQIVTGCGNCPFASSEHNWCNHPSLERTESFDWEFYGNDESSPEWCPLKKEDVIVSFKPANNG